MVLAFDVARDNPEPHRRSEERGDLTGLNQRRQPYATAPAVVREEPDILWTHVPAMKLRTGIVSLLALGLLAWFLRGTNFADVWHAGAAGARGPAHPVGADGRPDVRRPDDPVALPPQPAGRNAVSHGIQIDGHRIRRARSSARSRGGRDPAVSARAAGTAAGDLRLCHGGHGAGARSHHGAHAAGGLRLGLCRGLESSAAPARPHRILGGRWRCGCRDTAGDHVGPGHSSRADWPPGGHAGAGASGKAVQSRGSAGQHVQQRIRCDARRRASFSWPSPGRLLSGSRLRPRPGP